MGIYHGIIGGYMGELILCQTRLAAMPYYIESISLNIYSLEELCYYLDRYSDRLDETFGDEELLYWLEQELKCSELVRGIREKKRDAAGLAEIIALIVNACGYLEKKQKNELVRGLRELEHKSEFQKGRLRADRYLRNKRYAASILEYERLLHNSEEAVPAIEIGSIYHNMGVANAQMFLYEQAADCFQCAYEYNNHPESKKEMYFALQCISEKDGSKRYEPPAEWRDEVMQLLQQAVDESKPEEEGQDGKNLIETWKAAYRMYSKIYQ